ncbi:MAG: VOC family protein [Anaerolineales bacterium]|jgi:predicted enzyme related to lactoylglutathione lyase
MGRVVHFEIPSDDPQKAIQFYSDVFGWKSQKWEGPLEYWLLMTGEEGESGIDGAIMPRENPSDTTINTVDVASVEDVMAKIKQAGGAVLTDKISVPGVGYMAYCADPDGNKFGIMQADTSAK